jgi:F-type H+-transporting ATPase subunit epsilon
MPDSLIHLEIVTPGRVVFNDDVKSFTAPGIEGSFQVLAKHAPFISTIVPGTVKFVTRENIEKYFATGGGTVEVHSNKITMLAESLIPAEQINREEAEREKSEAEKVLDSKEPGHDREAAKHKLLAAKAKIKAAQNA